MLDNDEVLNIIIERKKLIKKERYNNDSVKGLKIKHLNKIEKLQEALLKYMRK